jgi:hypothetical protein
MAPHGGAQQFTKLMTFCTARALLAPTIFSVSAATSAQN